jgi:hypothetical protein
MMKTLKILSLTLLLGIFASLGAHAQEVGIRFGNVNGNNVALDGVFSLGEFSRVHGDMSFGKGGVGIDLLWNPIYKPIPDVPELNYYLGFGPSVFLGEPFNFGVAGEAGVEYAFKDAPFVIGLDWRPYFILVESTNLDFGGFGFNVRYRLN